MAWFSKRNQAAVRLCCALALGSAGFCRAAETNALVSETGSESVRLPLEIKRDHFVVRAQANGSNAVWLMLDTGFSITTIDPRLAELLKLRRTSKTTIVGIAGEEQADVFEGLTFDF